MTEKKTIRILISILLIAIIIASYLSSQSSFREEKTQFNMSAQVINVTGPNTKIGFATQTYEMNFGRIPIGGKSTKFIDVSNPTNKDAKIKISFDGNITPYIHYSHEELMIDPKDSMQIKITFIAEEMGNYTGQANIITYTPM